ncbi:hypothetical protein GOODEAATRI_026721 [Goodea atripinnis]|uniref:Uncharacterized protein n=1 Tax=Goodea atripinnis TaxID=208336 RepID=A0ABV0NE75_9TELE
MRDLREFSTIVGNREIKLVSKRNNCTSAHGDHWWDRGGVYSGSALYQQDKVRGEIHGEALQTPGEPPHRVQPKDGRNKPGAVVMQPPRLTGADLNELVVVYYHGSKEDRYQGILPVCFSALKCWCYCTAE